MIKQELLEAIESFKPLFIKLTNRPLKEFDGSKKAYLHLTREEREDLFYDIQARFIELHSIFDDRKGVPFAGYIKSNLGWFAHHRAEEIFETRKRFDFHADVDLLEDNLEDFEAEEQDYDLSFGLEEAINTLPPRQKTVIEMHYIEGLPISIIATELGITEEACYSHRKFGIQKLRKYLKENPL